MNIHCDNSNAINMSKNLVLHSYNKHSKIRHCFIKDFVKEKVVYLEFVPTEHHLVNILTKRLDSLLFEFLRKSLGLCLIDWTSKLRSKRFSSLIVYFLFVSFDLLLSLLWSYDLCLFTWFIISRVCEYEKYTMFTRLDVDWFIDIC